jgi:threonine dehydratase
VIPIADIEAARERIADVAVRTPLIRLHAPECPAEIWLKLECLQPIGAFKIRGAANAMRVAGPTALQRGVFTTSAGNMAQGVAWMAREEGVPATIIVPDHAPEAKTAAIERLGGTIIKVPFDRWWQAMVEGAYPGVEGHFVHPVQDPAVMAGNGTIGLELLEDLDDIDAVLVPWGGGGLFTGIASAMQARSRRTKVYACEPSTGAPMHASFAAGAPTPVDVDDRHVCAVAAGDRCRNPSPGRSGTGRRRRRRCARSRRGDVRWGGHRPHRLHRLRRQHRHRQARGDPARRRSLTQQH